MAGRKIQFLGTPGANPDTKPFFDAAAEGRFVVRKCTACNQVHWYPRALCPFCFSDKLDWVPASGRGSIYSFSVMKRAETPYAIAYVTLEEGPTMMTNIVDCDFDSIRIGQKVELAIRERGDGLPLHMFKPS